MNLTAPGRLAATGARVAPGCDADLAVMECLSAAHGEIVTREALRQRLGRSGEADDGLNAIIYRLRRRIERARPLLVPLQSKSRVGCVFRAPINAA
jgi:DNA-binding response OmpR family regulator